MWYKQQHTKIAHIDGARVVASKITSANAIMKRRQALTIPLTIAYSETKSGVISARLAEAMTPENILEKLMRLDEADYWIHNADADRVPPCGPGLLLAPILSTKINTAMAPSAR